MIAQAWLNVAGLSLDFVGVLLLAWEWWQALAAERREADIEALERRLAPHPSMPRPAGPHQAVFDHMREQSRAGARTGRQAAIRNVRRGLFGLAMTLIALGFALQLLGSWPGCCVFLNIAPQSN